jgi:rfaE bifunctional protein nucleotidyltransferase chain/domain
LVLETKINDLATLCERLALTRNGHRVVHCHGVFDLLHIGHIRHLQQAKALGDVLVVTLTPDRFVNKGPSRPAFNERLRAEAIAALDCVDFVAVNDGPEADATIRRLRPDLYVKGSEYKGRRDHSGAIVREEEAVASVGGRIVFTEDVTFSSSSLINAHLDLLSDDARAYLRDFGKRYSAADVHRWLDAARALKVLVIGEAIIDEYQYCEAIGKSSKEPTLAVKSRSSEKFAGGILAVANHVAGFCEHVTLVTALGEADPQEAFIREHLVAGVDPHFVYRHDAPTIVKRRFIEGYFFQKLFEVYEMDDTPMNGDAQRAVLRLLGDRLGGFDLVIVVDFGHGMISDAIVALLCEKARFLAVNAQSNAGNLGYHAVSKYPRADYVCVAENEMRLEARDRRGDLRRMIEHTSAKLDCPRVVVTRGSAGCLCYRRGGGFVEAPAIAGQVRDRMGAGDTFMALSALCAAQDAPMDVLAFVGNAAGAEAGATVGHRQPVTRAPLFKHMECLLK